MRKIPYRVFVQDDLIQRDRYLLRLLRKGHCRENLSLTSVSQFGSGKENSQQEDSTQGELGVLELLGEYGWNLLVLNTLAGKAAPHRPGQGTELSLCDEKPWETSGSRDAIHGLKKIILGHWMDGKCILKASTETALGYSIANQTEMMAWTK